METAQRADGSAVIAPVELRPMGLGELLDLAITLYRRNWITLIGISAVINLPLLFLQVIAAALALPSNIFELGQTPNSSLSSSEGMLLYYAALGLISLIGFVAQIFEAGAFSAAISERYLGRSITIKQAYGRALRRWLTLIFASVLVGLVELAVFAPFILLFLSSFVFSIAGSQSSTYAGFLGLASLCLCCGMILFIPVALYITTRLTFYTQAIVLENLNAPAAMGRSWRLVKNSFWRVFGTLALLWILIYILTIVPILTVQFGLNIFLPLAVMASTILGSVLGTLITILITPIQHAVVTLLYYDLRIRKEGFDLEFAMRQSDTALPNPPPAGGV